MKRRAIAIAMAIVLLFSGCSSTGLDAQTLMHPPKATGDMESIHTLLQKKVGDNITLKYPHSGDYRSAIIMHDITGNKQNEAIALYQNGGNDSEMHIVFIQKTNGQWSIIGSYRHTATQVDKVCFGDVNGDGRDEVIVGWENSISNTGELCVYSYNQDKISELDLKQSYSQMTVMDFNNDGIDEIFTASTTTPDQPAIAKLMHIKSNRLEIISIANLDTSVTKYAAINTGRINEKQYGVVLDGYKSTTSMVTEILYWDKVKKELVAPFYNSSSKSVKCTLRNTTTVSQDINNDKIIEIPTVNIMPGYSATVTDESCYITNWQRYDTTNNTLIKVMSTVVNSSGGYWLLIPDMWKDKIKVKTDATNHSMTFFEWKVLSKNGSGAEGEALLKIQVFTEKEWSSLKNTDGFIKLIEQNNTVYAVSIPHPNNTLSMKINDIQNSFKLISQD